MSIAKQPVAVINYNGRNITQDVSEYLMRVVYHDKTEKHADDIELTFDNTDARWENNWYPNFGDKLDIQMGYFGQPLLKCGVFEIDEIEMDGQPDILRVKGIATGIKSSLRTKKPYAHENKTLKQIVQKIASDNGLTVKGTIANVLIRRSTQNMETDLSYLMRLAEDYGYIFSIKGTQLIFTDIYKLETSKAILTLDKINLSKYTIRDKSERIYTGCEVSYHDPTTKTVLKRVITNPALAAEIEGYSGNDATTEDILRLRTRTETIEQATIKAKAHLYKKNSKKHQSHLRAEGDPRFVAGINFNLTGFGVLSGVHHIHESIHTLEGKHGYNMDLEVKRAVSPTGAQQKRKVIPHVTGSGKYPLISRITGQTFVTPGRFDNNGNTQTP